MLAEAGWIVQDYRGIDLTAGRGIAVREVPTKTGPVDYLLFGDGKALGTIEAKKEGETLRGVEWQTERYTEGFSELVEERPIPHWEPLPLPFHYQSTGAETLFTNLRDPIARPRDVFHFHRPETLIGWAQEEFSLLARLRRMPALDPERPARRPGPSDRGPRGVAAKRQAQGPDQHDHGLGQDLRRRRRGLPPPALRRRRADPLPRRPHQPRPPGLHRVRQLRHPRRPPQVHRALQRPGPALEPDRPGGQGRDHDDPAPLLDPARPVRRGVRPRGRGALDLRDRARDEPTRCCRSPTDPRSRSRPSTSASSTSATARSTGAGARCSTTSTCRSPASPPPPSTRPASTSTRTSSPSTSTSRPSPTASTSPTRPTGSRPRSPRRAARSPPAPGSRSATSAPAGASASSSRTRSPTTRRSSIGPWSTPIRSAPSSGPSRSGS